MLFKLLSQLETTSRPTLTPITRHLCSNKIRIKSQMDQGRPGEGPSTSYAPQFPLAPQPSIIRAEQKVGLLAFDTLF